ncbi:MAG: phosphomethylpyrimidine synthase ThiC [Tannerella sp.]|jgi:phosphomethylpyrimidine synthase|nr:phosphomethylpyrimidine synthase ThiC [Tannerella sp.]
MRNKVYIPGQINNIRVGMSQIVLSDTETVRPDGSKINKSNSPVTVYDTAGPYSGSPGIHAAGKGIDRIREEWYERRKDITRLEPPSGEPRGKDAFPVQPPVFRAREGKQITQMYYAKKRVVTPEMEYVAIRENQQVEAMGLKSYITPDFVRREIAAGRAIVPSNINHPEVEPMIIGRRFLVKVNTNINPYSRNAEETVGEMIRSCRWGTDTLIDLSSRDDCFHVREWLIRNCPVPVGTSPLYQALARAGGRPEELSWALFRDTLIEQARQGVDFMAIHAAMRKEHLLLTNSRLVNLVSRSGIILSEWMNTHGEENFLYTHFDEICEILKACDISLFLSSGLRPDAIYDANDPACIAELTEMRHLIEMAWKQHVQTIAEGPGHIPLHKIEANTKEHLYICKGVPFFTMGTTITDIAGVYGYIASAIGGAQAAWHGASLIGNGSMIPVGGREDLRAGIIAHKIAAHAADLAKGHPGAQVRDNALSKARREGRLNDIRRLTVDFSGGRHGVSAAEGQLTGQPFI